jgi:hypothetical protein
VAIVLTNITNKKGDSMTKLFWGLMIVLALSTSANAQISADKLTPEGTLWKLESIPPNDKPYVDIGFYAGVMWFCSNGQCVEYPKSNYWNFPISHFKLANEDEPYTVRGFTIPSLGVGIFKDCPAPRDELLCDSYSLAIISDSFVPPEAVNTFHSPVKAVPRWVYGVGR